ncbi:MAG TPA: hypothetical protein VIH61_00785 [Waddliaceae bacterium]
MQINPSLDLNTPFPKVLDPENKMKDISSLIHFIEFIQQHPEPIDQHLTYRLNKAHLSPPMTRIYQTLLEKYPRLFPQTNANILTDITLCNLSQSLESAIEFQLDDLKWQCLILAYEIGASKDFQALLQKQQISKEAITILNFGIECSKLNIKPVFTRNEYRTIKLDNLKMHEKQIALHTLKQLNETIKITGLEVSNELIDQLDAEGLGESTPDLKFLILYNCNIETIPNKWSNITELVCVDCPALANIKTPNATEIYCRNCPMVTNIDAARVTELECINLRSLIKITAPNASQFGCRGSINLTRITAPNALWVNCPGCIALKNIFAPIATWINCFECIALPYINVSQTVWLNCQRCTTLTNITAPKATQVSCHECTMLSEIIVPKGCRVEGQLPMDCKISRTKRANINNTI